MVKIGSNILLYGCWFFFSSRRRHTRSVSAFLLNRSSDLLEEILSFRMQGVEFDNGDMYVDGHKAASDVRDEFVSVTEKLVDELAQCYNVLPQLDINNTIDHRPEGDEKWFLENEKTVTQFCRKLAAERPLKDIRDEYNYPKKKGIKDECSRLLEASTMKSRRGFAIQRLMNAMRQAHA